MWVKAKLMLSILILVGFGASGCYKTTRVAAPAQQSKLLKTATAEELIEMINKTSNQITSLKSSVLEINAEGKNIETGDIEEYKNISAYIFLGRPKNIRFKILIPVSRTTLFDMGSNGETFQIWYPRENKFFVGNNNVDRKSYRKAVKNTLSNLRPQHLVDAVLIEKVLDEPGEVFSFREGGDAGDSYIIEIMKKGSGRREHTTRVIWIDRSDLRLARQQYYDQDGAIISDIKYRNYTQLEGVLFPFTIKIEQPVDKYSVTLAFKAVELNKALDADTFVLQKPPMAEVVEVKS